MIRTKSHVKNGRIKLEKLCALLRQAIKSLLMIVQAHRLPYCSDPRTMKQGNQRENLFFYKERVYSLDTPTTIYLPVIIQDRIWVLLRLTWQGTVEPTFKLNSY